MHGWQGRFEFLARYLSGEFNKDEQQRLGTSITLLEVTLLALS
jgi:hypothetical protein